ncbi:MAG: ferredoxin [Candidatus Omnitrophota bacterium]
MGKINIDSSLCTGCGLCASSCPETFEIRDDNMAHVLSDKIGCDVKDVAEQCPVSAINIQ